VLKERIKKMRGGGLWDMLFLMRPIVLIPVWTFFLAGYWRVEPDRWFRLEIWPFRVWLTGGGVTLVMAMAYILNQIADRETDRLNNKLFLLSEGYVELKSAWILAAASGFLGLILGFLSGIREGILLFALAVLAGYLYNFPPAEWKNRVFPGFLTNAAGGAVIYLAGVWAGQGKGTLLHSTAYLLAGGGVYLLTTVPDREGDRRAGKMTFSVKFGLKITVWTACVMVVSAVGMAWFVSDFILAVPGLLILPFFLYSFLRPDEESVIRSVKASVFGLFAGAAAAFPVYGAAVIMLIVITRWYYRRRFGLTYP